MIRHNLAAKRDYATSLRCGPDCPGLPLDSGTGTGLCERRRRQEHRICRHRRL